MLAFLGGQSPAAMKGIEEKLLSLSDGFNNEVTGQTNAGDLQATFYKAHPQNCAVISRGNPGPWPRYDPRVDPNVVLYYAVID